MRHTAVLVVGVLIGAAFASPCRTVSAQVPASSVATPPPVRNLLIDPLMLSSVKEYRNIIASVGAEIFPGWKANSVPILLYRPHVQELLIGAPRRPAGFSVLTSPTLPFLRGETIYARNDSTVMAVDDQNTSITLDSMRVLVVADQYSRIRSQIRDLLGRPSDIANRRLDEWINVPSPYDELQFLLHEAFHVHQHRLAPDKGADEGAVAHYPLLDPTNNALVALEGRILSDALLATDPVDRRTRIAEFVAVRTLRRAALDTASASYEDLNEYSEGLGRYVEFRFMQIGERVKPTPEMYMHTGFTGYRGVLRKKLEGRVADIVRIASNSDNRFGNRYGGGPLRFRLYDMGAAQGLLLDDVAPNWKSRIFAPGVYLTDLLVEAMHLSLAQREAYVSQAKARYGYDTLFANRQAFAAEGRRFIQQRVDAILGTSKTLVTISYAAVGEKIGMGYTPFGVTAVTDHSAIYDLVPVAVRFANKVVLRMKSVVPLLVDRGERTVTFAVEAPPSAFEGMGAAGLDLAEFTLSGSASTTIAISGNKVRIELK